MKYDYYYNEGKNKKLFIKKNGYNYLKVITIFYLSSLSWARTKDPMINSHVL